MPLPVPFFVPAASRTPLPLALLLAAGCAGGPVPPPPAAVAIGPAVGCIPITRIRETQVRGDQVIDFVVSGRQVFRNTLPQPCPGLGYERRFAYATSLTQLCSVDMVTVLTQAPVTRGASCGLGRFQPIVPPPRRETTGAARPALLRAPPRHP